MEERGLLVLGEAGRDALERVPQDAIRRADLVDWEVALEHAALDAEAVDRVQVPLARGLGQLGRGGRLGALVEVEAVERHDEPAQLGHDVATLGERPDGAAPAGEDLRTPATIGPDAERPAEVIEHDRRVGERPREVRHLAELWVIAPGVERQPAPRQLGEATAEARIAEEPRRRVRVRVAHGLAGVPAGRVTDTTEARAGRQVGVQHGAHGLAERQIRERHDAGRDARGPVAAARAHGGDAVDELRLAHRA